jgi:hypothetical protein
VAAYAVTFGVMVGFEEASAEITLPSSICHAGTDNIGSSLQNSGAMTYTGTGTLSIFCPVIEPYGVSLTTIDYMNVYGSEGTDGSKSRACACTLDPVDCWCGNYKAWTNGNYGLVASNLDSPWTIIPEQQFGYILHTLTQNSSLAGMWISN